MPNLPSIVITPVKPLAIGGSLQAADWSVTPAQTRDIWSDFLSLKISANTQRVYAKAIADFCGRVYDRPVSAEAISKFLKLPPSEALFQVLNYRRLLIEAKLAPSTINVRLSALKSLVDYARKMGECQFSLADVSGMKGETYRDTTGIGIEEFRNVRAAQALSRHKNLNTLTRYDDNRHQYQKTASDVLGDLLDKNSDS